MCVQTTDDPKSNTFYFLPLAYYPVEDNNSRNSEVYAMDALRPMNDLAVQRCQFEDDREREGMTSAV